MRIPLLRKPLQVSITMEPHRNLHLVLFVACLAVAHLSTVAQCDLRKPLNGTLYSKRLQSGAIFLLDTCTILVTQFSYDNGPYKNLRNLHNKWFKGVVGSTDERLVDLEYLNGTNAQLTENLYLGLNVYLRVPDCPDGKYDMSRFNALRIVNEKDASKTSVPITQEDIEGLPRGGGLPIYKNNDFVFVYPKCCPFKQIYLSEGNNNTCIDGSVDPEVPRFPVYEENGNLFNNGSAMEQIYYEPYVHNPRCNRVPFQPEPGLWLLSNLEVIVPENPRTKLVCMDMVMENNVLIETIYICLNDTTEGVDRGTFGRGQASLSTGCLLLSVLSVLLSTIVILFV